MNGQTTELTTTELTTTGGELRKIEATPETSVLSLIQLAIEKGQDATELYAILREERGDHRKKAFIAAKAQFQAQCPAVPKAGTNSQYKVTRDGVQRDSRFAPLDVMQRIAGPHLTANGFGAQFQRDLEYEASHPGWVCELLVMAHAQGHAESYPCPMPIPKPVINSAGKAVQNDCQCVGVALEYSRRQAYREGTGIRLEGEDTDGNLPDGADAETVTEEQARTLNDLLLQLTDARKPKFLAYMGVAKLSEIPAAEFNRAADALEKEIKAMRKGGT